MTSRTLAFLTAALANGVNLGLYLVVGYFWPSRALLVGLRQDSLEPVRKQGIDELTALL